MNAATPVPMIGLPPIWSRARLKTAVLCGLAVGAVLTLGWQSSLGGLFLRTITIALILMTVFGVFERWPRELPLWLARWALQVVMVAVTTPIIIAIIYELSTAEGAPHFYKVKERMEGYSALTGFFLLTAPWASLTAIFRQKDAIARDQALKLDLAQSELERVGLESRMRLLQAQVQPHFLFNTLANVRELVEAGSPQASAVLESLIAYLRAAVPRLNDPVTTLEQEVQLVRAYLEIMHMRMPDRLQFDLHVDDAALPLPCPPMTLLTLVENAVRHGVDPSEQGGHIEIRVIVDAGRVRMSVRDSGVGMQASGNGLGTGLAALRERLQLVFGGDASVRLDPLQPHGMVAEVTFPASVIPSGGVIPSEARDPASKPDPSSLRSSG